MIRHVQMIGRINGNTLGRLTSYIVYFTDSATGQVFRTWVVAFGLASQSERFNFRRQRDDQNPRPLTNFSFSLIPVLWHFATYSSASAKRFDQFAQIIGELYRGCTEFQCVIGPNGAIGIHQPLEHGFARMKRIKLVNVRDKFGLAPFSHQSERAQCLCDGISVYMTFPLRNAVVISKHTLNI